MPKRLLALVRPPSDTGLAHRSLLPPDELLGDPNRFVRTTPYPDVDKDGAKDVLELDLDLRDGHPVYGFIGTLRLNTISGRTGKAIARFSMPFDSGVPYVLPARLGEDAKPGVIVVLYRFLSTPEHPTSELLVKAVSSKGKEIWTKQITSTSTSTPTRFVGATDLASPSDLLEAPGQSADVLVNIYDYAGAVLTLTPAVIDGATGELREQLPIAVPWIDGTPVAIGTPDLDMDLDLGRRDDILIVDTTGVRRGLMARSSSTGDELWHNLTAPAGDGHTAAGVRNATGDMANDFILGAPLRLIDGSTGDPVWERDGGPIVITTGLVDQDKKPDVLAMGGRHNENRFGAAIKVVSSTGERLGSSTYMAKAPSEGFWWFLYEPTGDVNGDRIDDVFIWLIGDGQRDISIDGASGKAILESRTLYPLLGSLSGRAEDLVDVTQRKGRFVVTPLTSEGRALWRSVVRSSEDYYVSSVNAVGDSVVLTLFGRRGATTFKLDGRTGSVIWTRTLGS